MADCGGRPFLIGVAGGTASGKSTVCEKIIQSVSDQRRRNSVVDSAGKQIARRQVISLAQDSFYRNLTAEESAQAQKGAFNFDHPDAIDYDLMLECLTSIVQRQPTNIPVYDFKANARVEGQFRLVEPSDVILVEGILIFYYKQIRNLFDMRLFVDCDSDTRLARRVLCDTEERDRSLDSVLHQYCTFVKPAFEEFCLPTKKFADVIVPRGVDNQVAISLIVQHICDYLDETAGGSYPATEPSSGDTAAQTGSHVHVNVETNRPH